MRFGWLRVALDRIVPPDEDLGPERQEAATIRARAERALVDEHDRTIEVRRVAATSRKLRAENNFSRRITESFREQR